MQSNYEFLEYIKGDEKKELIPKFFYKKMSNFNDFTFAFYSEAKNRFLSEKQAQIPRKIGK